jgi:resuscitation-promoting factor RpfA
MGPRNQPKRTRIRTAQLLALALVATAVSVVVPVAPASADPSAADWLKLRMCESSNNYQIDTGNNHYGAYQFDLATWHGVGGLGYPYLARPADQDARALILYRQRGWQPWQCATIVGLHDDHDARSGRISDIKLPPPLAPAFPGTRAYHIGDNNTTIKSFQAQMHTRGWAPIGTGGFGPVTEVMVKRLQQLNGIVANGSLGTTTWHAAWTGRYSELPVAGPAKTAPPYPGTRAYHIGDNNTTIKAFQNEMHLRGFAPVGTGGFGPITQAMVIRLQQRNGLVANGSLGTTTWNRAWTGWY